MHNESINEENFVDTKNRKTITTTVSNQILLIPHHKLRTVSDRVESFDDSLSETVFIMRKVLNDSHGIGLAAPQVGVNRRIIIVDVPKQEETENSEVLSFGRYEMINPSIIEQSKVTSEMNEGCLSIPGISESVERSSYIVVSYADTDGQTKVLRANGLLARCIQHEVDHLNGVLFIDKLSSLKKDMIVRKMKKFQKKGVMVVKASNINVF